MMKGAYSVINKLAAVCVTVEIPLVSSYVAGHGAVEYFWKKKGTVA
jgi:hypothetical protein